MDYTLLVVVGVEVLELVLVLVAGGCSSWTSNCWIMAWLASKRRWAFSACSLSNAMRSLCITRSLSRRSSCSRIKASSVAFAWSWSRVIAAKRSRSTSSRCWSCSFSAAST
ncbi:hypothetical protein H257_15051 [Aphanomyces astaci]|uniref:Uncharacterized protein n=1 Tax=Aphanomyces astaci TaxID=112090 RepID=W4FP10_APHAT|nr:hypothetical protein H257_15051 [Aphanomyces astaci]ETV69232.1 hypothetical protein H257_15051 [Aphanomyces astaci]|eukprot:XP_009841334.1 hypothetical protein H257_15051 [Aphanomyces astaci]